MVLAISIIDILSAILSGILSTMLSIVSIILAIYSIITSKKSFDRLDQRFDDLSSKKKNNNTRRGAGEPILQRAKYWFAEGYVAFVNEEYDGAILYYSRAIKSSPHYAKAHSNLGFVYAEGKKDYEKAIECYEKVIELKPDDADAYYDLGLVYYTYDKVRIAKNYLKEAARLGNKPAQQWLRDKDIPWQLNNETS